MIALAQKDFEARNSLVAQYAYLCKRGARKFCRPGLDRAHLEQVAAIGLIKAGVEGGISADVEWAGELQGQTPGSKLG